MRLQPVSGANHTIMKKKEMLPKILMPLNAVNSLAMRHH